MNRTHWVAALGMFFIGLPCGAQPAPPGARELDENPILGLWGIEQTLRPVVRGELTIDARGPEWRASIAGTQATVKRSQNALTAVFSGNKGEFRGHLEAGTRRVTGQWIQPGGTYPYNQRYASPVELSEVQPQVWRGHVTPLEENISFYVQIQRAPDGSLSAFIRNPEANLFRRRVYAVGVNDSKVTLSSEGEQLRGSYNHQADELTLPLLDGHPPLQLTRRERDNAAGFYPRAGQQSYTYAKPIAENDGWRTASLAEVGLDVKPITALIEKILGADRAADELQMHSLLIARHGKLVLEEYFYGHHKDRPHDMRSASKTFAPVLVGIARDRGAKVGPETPVYSMFPEYKPFAAWEERKNRVKVRDLMNMTTGMACNDGDQSSPGQEDRMQQQREQPDWYKYTLDLAMVNEPGGEHAVYCSASINLVGGVARNATGKWLPELFYESLAKPLDMQRYHINLMPTGEAYAGGGIYMRPRDQLKLGQLYLNGGVWNGRRVVSTDWVKQSLTRQVMFPRRVTSIDANHGYSYAWHVRDLKAGNRVFRDYYAGGNGGQNVIIIPELDMVIGFTGGSYAEPKKTFRWELELVPQYIIPAAVAAGPSRE